MILAVSTPIRLATYHAVDKAIICVQLSRSAGLVFPSRLNIQGRRDVTHYRRS